MNDQLRHERDTSLRQSREEHREVAQLGERLIAMTKKQQADLDDILEKNRDHMSMVQAQWNNERERLQAEIRELKKGKADLQMEIGWLLRDKQTSQGELGQILRSLDVQRDRFRREVLQPGGMAYARPENKFEPSSQ
jgi:chromosome segregation ATPase